MSLIGSEIKKEALSRLKNAGVPNPLLDIEKFISHLEKKNIFGLQASNDFWVMIDRRCLREPVERILGYASFFGEQYLVHPSVFRSTLETETTVEHALECAQKLKKPLRILDLGCGNGCMLISMLLKLKDATGVGVDLNPQAIKLSIENATAHKVQNRAEFIVSDWANNFSEKFDIILSNPPRIANKHLDKLVWEVSKYDPTESLNGGADGLEFYQRTIEAIPKISNSDCYIVMQTGQISYLAALEVFQRSGYRDVQIGRDFRFQPNCLVLSNKVSRSRRWVSEFLFRTNHFLKEITRQNHDVLHN